ncbi:MAG: hypothetical protein ACPGRE_09075 [Flavobacteriaceae bacterium]
MSKEYTSTARYSVRYENLPEDKILQNKPTNEVQILIKGTGYRILREKWLSPVLNLDASNLTKTNGSIYVLSPNNQLAYIESQSSQVIVQRVLKDTIRLDLGTLMRKKVPVSLIQDIEFKQGYHHDGRFEIRPDSIEVVGPGKSLSQLSNIETQKLILKEVSDTIKRELDLNLSQFSDGDFKFSQSRVQIFAPVEKYTEGVFMLPVKILNVPKDIELTVFPKTVELFYQTGLSKFNSVLPSDFEVSCDFEEAQKLGLKALELKVTSKSKYVSFYRVSPSQLEYLISKK